MTTTVAVDLAQTVFERAITDDQGRLAERQCLSREAFARFFAHRPPGRIVMDACATAHHGARTFQAQGHTVNRLPPQQVRPYGRRHKTDRTAAAALLEADRCPAILAAPVKSEAPQGLQGLHRVRSAWMATRTDRVNATRALLRELDLDLPQGPAAVLERAPALLAQGQGPMPPALRPALAERIAEICVLEARIADLEKQLRAAVKPRPDVQRRRAVPGIGLLIATAPAAAVGGLEAFRDGRHLAAWLGLTPRESSSGPRRPQQSRANTLARIAFAVVRQGRAFDGDGVPGLA